MGDLFSLFWEVDPPPLPISFTIPSQDYECQKDDSCGTIGSFLLWYFIIILVLMFFSRASVWMSESKRKEDNGTSASASKADKTASHKRPSKGGSWDSSETVKKPKQNPLSPVTDSEVALVNAYLEQRRARRHAQFQQVTRNQQDSDATECDSEESSSGASSWKESESEHHPSPASIKRRRSAQKQRDLENYQIRERPCLHCKAMRTNEWLARHFLQSTSVPVKGELQEENSTPDGTTKISKF